MAERSLGSGGHDFHVTLAIERAIRTGPVLEVPHAQHLDGVFATAPDGTTRFDPAPPPTDREVARLLAAIRTRILRLLRHRGVLAADDATDLEADPLAIDTPVLAQLSAAAVRGRGRWCIRSTRA